MELLLDALFNKKEKSAIAGTKIKIGYYINLIALAGVSFLLGRVALFENIFPCGPALTAVLMSRGKINVYALPFILLGSFTNKWTGYDVWGDIIATVICGAVFFLLNKRKLSLLGVGIITAAITSIVKAFIIITGPIVFKYDIIMLCMEAVLVVGFVYLFYFFFNIMDKSNEKEKPIAQGIVVLSAVSILAVGGLGIDTIAFFSPVYVVSLFISLFIGYKMGVMEGGLAGIASGLTLMMVASGTPAIIGIFACSGMVAGFFTGLSRIVTGTCFIAVCLGFGMIKGYPELYLTAADPIIAAVIFMFLPQKLIYKLEILLARLRDCEQYYDLISREKIKNTLHGYLETFEKLAALYGRTKDSQSIIPMQFKALTRLTKNMILDLDKPEKANIMQKPRYNVDVGVSGYAKEDNISGDSYLCTEMKNGDYILALSDGMGKGRRAADESGLTISTLHNLLKAGFDIELALRTINSLLLANSTEEIFSTVDMGILNRNTGNLQLFKIGAAATFIKRGDHVEAIKIAALPIGIINRISVDSIDIKVRKGDEIIIVSDGITDADREDRQLDWLIDTIVNIKSKDPQTMSDLIINKAVERYGLKEKDDMTVITAVVN
ncbi:SpoIIE family protein phosphatase [Anaerovorax odorimutans]|uniref:SpoIIE family protein phosphatase n=1 Tax=Anaerovorax odorimutans TaxID=109327 RepID=UPI000413E170|nr:SpoIIE family protein phosphatase [Anaerovorax odorimutans]